MQKTRNMILQVADFLSFLPLTCVFVMIAFSLIELFYSK